MVKQFKFDYSILGCSAIDTDGDLLDYDGQEIIVSQTAINRSRQVIIVADYLKFERKAPLTSCSLSDINTIITDKPLSEKLKINCKTWKTEIINTQG
jgi:DeoR family glycerol-3-phosphate regulon repressor